MHAPEPGGLPPRDQQSILSLPGGGLPPGDQQSILSLPGGGARSLKHVVSEQMSALATRLCREPARPPACVLLACCPGPDGRVARRPASWGAQVWVEHQGGQAGQLRAQEAAPDPAGERLHGHGRPALPAARRPSGLASPLLGMHAAAQAPLAAAAPWHTCPAALPRRADSP